MEPRSNLIATRFKPILPRSNLIPPRSNLIRLRSYLTEQRFNWIFANAP
jgi:hypothetical protein